MVLEVVVLVLGVLLVPVLVVVIMEKMTIVEAKQ